MMVESSAMWMGMDLPVSKDEKESFSTITWFEDRHKYFIMGIPNGRKPNKFFCIDSSLGTIPYKYRKPKDKMSSTTSSSSASMTSMNPDEVN